MVFIYGLICPEKGEIRYIGKSTRPEARLIAHVTCSIRRRHSHKERWIAGLADRGLRPTVWILEEVSEDQRWQDRERAWIARAIEMGLDLTNQTAGGEGLDLIDPEAKRLYLAKLSSSMKMAHANNPKLAEVAALATRDSWVKNRQARIDALRAALDDPIVKHRLAAAMKEVRERPEYKEVRSRTSREIWKTHHDSLMAARKDPLTRERQSIAKVAAWKDPQKRANLMNRWTDAAREKQAAEMLSRKEKMKAAMTPEVIARRAATLKATWARKKAG